jgi:hypothetical protein
VGTAPGGDKASPTLQGVSASVLHGLIALTSGCCSRSGPIGHLPISTSPGASTYNDRAAGRIPAISTCIESLDIFRGGVSPNDKKIHEGRQQ